MKYKIVFDTNIIRDGDFLEVKNIYDFLNQHSDMKNVSLGIPKIALEEWKQYKKTQIKEVYSKAKSAIKRLVEFGHPDVSLEKIDEVQFVENLWEKKSKGFKYEIIEIPPIEQEKLIFRALTKQSPFNNGKQSDGNSDYGFKDTILLLSIKNDAQKYKFDGMTYILLTNDKGFNSSVSEEFLNDTTHRLIIMSDLSKLKDELDEWLELGLKLTEKRAKIENIVTENRERFDVFLLKQYTKDQFASQIYTEDIDGYSFNSFHIDDFFESGKELFRVNGRIIADIIYRNKKGQSSSTLGQHAEFAVAYEQPVYVVNSSESTASILGQWSPVWRKQHETFFVSLIADLEKKDFKIIP